MKYLIILCGIMLISFSPTKAIPVSFDNEQQCLANNIYFEARSEGTAGQIAVAQVTLNRVYNERFPSTICEVVREGKEVNGVPVKNRCQFSWYCDGVADIIKNAEAYERADHLANFLLTSEMPDITDGALYYHNTTVSPGWKRKRIIKIGNHIFYG